MTVAPATETTLASDLLAVVARINRLANQRVRLPLPFAQARLLSTIEAEGRARISDLAALGLSAGADDAPAFNAHDLLTGATYAWGSEAYVRLNPFENVAHIIQVGHP